MSINKIINSNLTQTIKFNSFLAINEKYHSYWFVTEPPYQNGETTGNIKSYYSYQNACASDSKGNIYSVGAYANSSGYNRGSLVKRNNNGVYVWGAGAYFSSTLSNEIWQSVAIDTSDTPYVAGQAYNASQGTNGAILHYLSNTSDSSFSVSGRVLSDANTAANQGTVCTGITIDSSGNIYISGFFRTTDSGTNYNSFIIKYDSSWNIIWQRYLRDGNIAGSQNTQGNDISIDTSGNVYYVGNYKNTSGGFGGFIAKYNSSGTLQWQKTLNDGNTAANQNTYIYGCTIDTSGNIYICGEYKNASAGQNIFIAKYNTSGTIQWQRSLTTSLSASLQINRSYSISIDSSNNLYICGSILTAQRGGFIAKYDSSGTIQWQREIYGNVSSDFDSYGITIDKNQNIYIVGYVVQINGPLYLSYTIKVASDGSQTGTYYYNNKVYITYTTGTLTDSSSSLTDAVGSLTAGTSSLTSTNSTPTSIKYSSLDYIPQESNNDFTGIPYAPTIGTASITNTTTISLAFTAPIIDGNSTITEYKAISSPSIALTVSGTTSPLTITGTFAKGISYTIQITAINANGYGEYSNPSNSIKPNP